MADIFTSTPQDREETNNKMANRVELADLLVSQTVSQPQSQSQKESDAGDFFMTSC